MTDSSAVATRTASWGKVGLVIRPDRRLWWAQTHAMVPTPELLDGGLCRVFFSGRDSTNRSHVGFAVVDLAAGGKLLDYSSEPVLAPGALGCFDDNGVTPSCVIDVGNKKHLYYIGWNPGSTVRLHLFAGLAISEDGGRKFERWSHAPILERNRVNPYMNTGPWVIPAPDGFRMYYVAGVGWVHKDLPRYNIQMATSKNGLEWKRLGEVALDFADATENALARPYVIHRPGRWEMWYSHKGDSYKIGYAESEDGKQWRRLNDACTFRGNATFDSEMMEYAAVVEFRGRRYMFYNGNNYGSDGIALAVQE